MNSIKIALAVCLAHLTGIVWLAWNGDTPTPTPTSQKVVVQTIRIAPPPPKTLANKSPPKKVAPKKKAAPKKDTHIAQAKEIIGKYKRNRGKVSSSNNPIVVPNAIVPTRENYVDLLVARLKQTLRLPEYGEVKIQLTLERNGKVKKFEILHAKSTMNKDYVMKKIKTLALPPFEKHLSTNEQTFILALQND